MAKARLGHASDHISTDVLTQHNYRILTEMCTSHCWHGISKGIQLNMFNASEKSFTFYMGTSKT